LSVEPMERREGGKAEAMSLFGERGKNEKRAWIRLEVKVKNGCMWGQQYGERTFATYPSVTE